MSHLTLLPRYDENVATFDVIPQRGRLFQAPEGHIDLAIVHRPNGRDGIIEDYSGNLARVYKRQGMESEEAHRTAYRRIIEVITEGGITVLNVPNCEADKLILPEEMVSIAGETLISVADRVDELFEQPGERIFSFRSHFL